MAASVLVVDDDKLMRDILKAMLKANGFAVAGEATDGEQALRVMERVTPDVICLDVNMPGMSGLDTLKGIRAKMPAIRVVMITADATLNTVRDAVSFGAAGYIIKPFSEAKVVDAVRRAVAQVSS